MMPELSFFSVLAMLHGVFYILTGIWPVVHIGSFLRVTGPKTDLWLVRTVGLLITVIGAALLAAGYGGQPSLEVLILAIGAPVALIAVDLIYVLARVISRIYLLDAVVELGLVLAWIAVAMQLNLDSA